MQVNVTFIPSSIITVLNISWTYPQALESNIYFFYITIEYRGPCENVSGPFLTDTEGYSVRSTVFTHLEEFSVYTVTVATVRIVGDDVSDSVTVMTPPGGKDTETGSEICIAKAS